MAMNTLLNGHPHKVRCWQLHGPVGKLRHVALRGLGSWVEAVPAAAGGSAWLSPQPRPLLSSRLGSAATPSPPSTCPSSPKSSWTKTKVEEGAEFGVLDGVTVLPLTLFDPLCPRQPGRPSCGACGR